MSEKTSIVLINHNDAKWLPQALDSCLKQSEKNIELIAVDDCSTDESRNIIKKFADADKRVVPIFLDEQSGISKARNLGVKAATGKFIAFFDSDDIMLRDTISNYVQKWDELKAIKPSLVMLTTDAYLVNEKGARKGRYMPDEWHDKVEIENPPMYTLPSAWFIEKASCVEFCDFYKTGEAWFFIHRMQRRGAIAFWGKPNIEYRIRMKSVTNKNGKEVLRSISAANATIKRGCWDNPIPLNEVSKPTWREYAEWSYGRSAKSAAINGRWMTAGFYGLLSLAANPKRCLERGGRTLRGIFSTKDAAGAKNK